MSTYTTSLTLVYVDINDSLNSLLSALRKHEYQVDKFSTREWIEHVPKDKAPNIVFINPGDGRSDSPNNFAGKVNEAADLLLVLDSCKNIEPVLHQNQTRFYWPSQSQPLLEYLSTSCHAGRKNYDNRLLREEFVKLNLIGSSSAFLSTLKILKKYSKYDVPVLIRGETGTGKEMAARAIHYLSGRADQPFIPVDCGALPENLVENELFGHERGAYTDARQSQLGLVTQADGGTLFLDEIDALSLKAQVTLLRFLQSREYRPLGGQRSQIANIRIIAATNANLTALVAEEKFRQDLLFRIDVLSLILPALRQRVGDVEILASYFLDKYRRRYNKPAQDIHLQTLVWMRQYDWPGNVRELENFIHRELLLSEDGVIKYVDGDLSELRERRFLLDRRLDISLDLSFNEAKTKLVLDFEKKYLRLLMQESSGNVTKAARISGKERRALGKLLKKHDIDKDEFTAS